MNIHKVRKVSIFLIFSLLREGKDNLQMQTLNSSVTQGLTGKILRSNIYLITKVN
jgi:hypothetical protein